MLSIRGVDISERISYWLGKANLKQADLARALDVSTAAVSQWVNGKANPSAASIEAIAAACGVTMAKFWGPIPAKAS